MIKFTVITTGKARDQAEVNRLKDNIGELLRVDSGYSSVVVADLDPDKDLKHDTPKIGDWIYISLPDWNQGCCIEKVTSLSKDGEFCTESGAIWSKRDCVILPKHILNELKKSFLENFPSPPTQRGKGEH